MVEKQLAEEAKKRMLSGKKDPTVNLPQGSNKKRNPETTTTVAKKLGVSRKTYEGMKTVVKEGVELSSSPQRKPRDIMSLATQIR